MSSSLSVCAPETSPGLMAESGVDVVVQIAGEDVLAGRLWAHRRRAAQSATFAYDAAYLTDPRAYELDPALPLVADQHQTAVGQLLFGAFSDSAPDRWGRRLIEREQRLRAESDELAPRRPGEIDYLLGVRDDLRQGAVRFRAPGGSVYLAEETAGVPLLVQLPVLLNAAEQLDRDEATEEELRMLLRGGSSLGGARPKAHVLTADGRAAIAKFPSPSKDNWDVMRWEAVALDLAQRAGIRVPRWELLEIDGKAVVIIDRFDRAGALRIGFVSAMTMLGATDHDRGCYLEIAEVIEESSPQTSDDLRELWRRIALSILISNTDDHLRNHGFLRTSSAGWTLSPAFDLNPDPEPGPKELSTDIDFGAPSASLETLMSVADHFRLRADEARTVLGEVVAATSQWRAVADHHGLDRSAIEGMEPAFEHEQAVRALQIVAPVSAPQPARDAT